MQHLRSGLRWGKEIKSWKWGGFLPWFQIYFGIISIMTVISNPHPNLAPGAQEDEKSLPFSSGMEVLDWFQPGDRDVREAVKSLSMFFFFCWTRRLLILDAVAESSTPSACTTKLLSGGQLSWEVWWTLSGCYQSKKYTFLGFRYWDSRTTC